MSMRLMYSPTQQVFVFTFGDQTVPMGEKRFFQTKEEAVAAARHQGLKVDKKGLVSSVNPSNMNGLDGVSPRTRKGARVRFAPNPASHLLYNNPPAVGEEGNVTTMPGFGGRTYLPGPGGGLLYVKWDKHGVMGVSPNDLKKAAGRRSGALRVGQGRPGQKFSHGDVEIETTLHPVKGFDGVDVDDLDAFTRQYIETALWSSTGDDEEPLDKNYGPEDLSEDALAKMVKDSQKFQKENWDAISGDLSQAGHDFWLTRNGHGAGFWDGDWPDPLGDVLTAASKKFGEQWIYVGDDGQLYVQ